MIFCRSILTFSRFKIWTRTNIRFCSEKSPNMSLRIPVQKVLCVAEKNDAAKGISDIMSNGRMRRLCPRETQPSGTLLPVLAETQQRRHWLPLLSIKPS
ncbi:hypothetical protein AB205_0003230 [Aquarana catesbeiana]|uniref:Uncharacterized protein n=1 Tax=Aquarana catesbeiana TaxID=8400 RepID=A0A2G9RJA5_AQUCT|nr:hypothetical protein AB205_0003230 [Aquarana catesbeiana]